VFERSLSPFDCEAFDVGSSEQTNSADGLNRSSQPPVTRKKPDHVGGKAEDPRSVDCAHEVFGIATARSHSCLREA
jgi:hypothetical protein